MDDYGSLIAFVLTFVLAFRWFERPAPSDPTALRRFDIEPPKELPRTYSEYVADLYGKRRG